MSLHPNVLLILRLTPDDLPRKTMRGILEEMDIKDGDDLTIGGLNYNYVVMDDEYNSSWQISAKEGDIIIFNLATYGYGESILWADLESQKTVLEQWAIQICYKFHCAYTIHVSANYW